MKFATILFIAAIVAYASAEPIDRGSLVCSNIVALDGRPCLTSASPSSVFKTEIVYHSGKPGDHAADIKAGDLLNDKIREVLDDESPRKEILLKCKVPGCSFNLASSVVITGGFKIRGELKHGQRPNILLSAPFTIGSLTATDSDNGVGSDFSIESVNIIGAGKQSQGHLVLQKSICGGYDRCVIGFDKVAFKNLNVGFSHGGAIEVKSTFTDFLDIQSCAFINNSAKKGGAIWMDLVATAGVRIFNTKFIGNAAIEEGGALYVENGRTNAYCDAEDLVTNEDGGLEIAGCHFKDNTANKKGDTFVGRGGAIFALNASILLRDSRTHGGNAAKFGNLIHASGSCVGVIRFGCYEGPFSHMLNSNGYEGYGDYYAAYPVCSADSYDTYALREDIYARNATNLFITGVDLPGGVTCEESGAASVVTRHGCGSHIYAYHCQYSDDDHYVEAEDYDRDGFDCRYDCNDIWKTVNPAAGEQCNKTVININGIRDSSEVIYLANENIDSNCNGLHNEFVDMDGDHVADWYDQCPHDYWKVSPGKCGCGYEDTEGCVQAGGSAECTTVEDGGVWYYMCEGNWWYWESNDWTYGGTY